MAQSVADDAEANLGFPPVVRIDIDGGRALDEGLASALAVACDKVEYGASQALLVLRIHGSTVACPTWPGAVQLSAVRKWEEAVRRLDRLVGLSVVAVSGRCSGVALELLAAADQRIACGELSLVGLCESGASWPGTALHRVTRRSGVAAARRLFVLPSDTRADELMRLGLVDRIVDDIDASEAALAAEHRGVDLAAVQRRRLLVEETAGGGAYEQLLGAHLAACDAELRRRAATSAAAPARHARPCA